MLIRDIMTKDVVTVTSDTSVIDAKRIMDRRKLRRLPVVDKGKLVGVISEGRLERAVPPDISASTSIWDLTYNLSTIHQRPVKEIMHTEVVTISPDATVEEAVALAQARKVGGLVVVEKGNKVVGVVTTNDFFYRIVNPVLGIGLPGYRLWVEDGGEGKALEDIIVTINKLGMNIVTLHIIIPPGHEKKDLVVHVDGDKPDELVAALKKKGYEVDIRRR